MRAEPVEGDPRAPPTTDWPPWTAPAALVGGLVLAAVGACWSISPRSLLGVKITELAHARRAWTIADTVVQDVASSARAVYCAQLGGRVVRSWQFGLRTPGAAGGGGGWCCSLLLIVCS